MKNKKAKQSSPVNINKPVQVIPPQTARRPLHNSPILLLFVAAFSFLLYSNTLKHDYANDDLASVVENKAIQQGWGNLTDVLTKANWYGYGGQNHSILRPFTGFTFATEIEFFGPNPHVQHFTNTLLYTLACCVLYLLLKRLLSGFHPLLPVAATLLFAAHPIHTEVVANIKSRDEILSFLFGLALPLYFLLRFVAKPKPWLMVLALSSYLLGVFSKESAVTFLLIFPLTLYFFTTVSIKRIVLVCLPFLLPVVLFLLARASWLDPAPADNTKVIDNVVFAATTFGAKLATISVILLEYLRLLVLPHPLSWDYSYNQIPLASFANVKAIFSLLLHVALGVAALWGLRSKKLWAYCILFYLITMSVYSNLLVPIHATLGERFLFSPSLAFCIALAYGAFLVTGALRVQGQQLPKVFNYGMVLLAIVVTLYSFKTVARNKDWKDSLTISKAGALTSPNSARAHSAYGSSLMKLGEASTDPAERQQYFTEALKETKEAVRIYPHDADYVYNYGVLSFYLNDTASARAQFAKAVSMDSRKLNALFNLGATYEKEGRPDKAMTYYRRVQALDSTFQNVCFYIGSTALKTKQYDEAIQNVTASLRFYPENAEAYNVLGAAYFNKQLLEKATTAFEKAIQMSPNRPDYYSNAASVYFTLQQYAKAAQFYELALQYDPGNQNYKTYMATCRQLAGSKQ